MFKPVPSSKPAPIDWQFTIAAQGFVTRFGKMGPDYYRQYLPFGVLDEIGHPPKKITEQLYKLAQYKALQSAQGSSPKRR